MRTDRLALPAWLLPVFGVGALLALGGGLWDDAWHTERGRDTFFIPPHVAIYGGITLVGAGISLWIVLAARVGGWRAALRDPVIALASVSVAVTLASAPVDNVWHEAFGRDAVIWSPPHVLGIVGTGSLAVAILVDLARSGAGWARRAHGPVGGLLLAAFAFLVVEYETDVPQFATRWYLPVLALGAGFAFAVIGRLGAQRWPAVRAAAWHLGFVLVVGGFLLTQDLDPPRLPLLLAPALVLDLTAGRSLWTRSAAAAVALFAVYVPAGYVGHGAQLDGPDILIGLPLAVAAFALTLAAVGTERPRIGPLAATPLTLVMLLAVLPPSAIAHDPGQGPDAGTVDLRVASRDGVATVTARAGADRRLAPVTILARRGGVTRRGVLEQTEPGVFRGRIDLTEPGRWFVYVDLREPDGDVLEAWLPAQGDGVDVAADARRFAYVLDRPPSSTGKWVAGVVLYVLVAAFLAAITTLVRRVGLQPVSR